VLLTLTPDTGKVLSVTHNIELGGTSDLLGALQVAQLALNHRAARAHAQRIVAFVGSPLARHSADELRAVALQLRQSNVSVDVVSFGEVEANAEKLAAFMAAVSKGDSSHMLTVEPGPHLLVDRVVMSPIVHGTDATVAAIAQQASGGGASGGGSGAAAAVDVGFNPELDPELATVLRESIQEFQRQAEAAAAAAAQAPAGAAPAPAPQQDDALISDEDEELRKALAMSVVVDQQKTPEATTPAPLPTTAPRSVVAEPTPMELSEDQQMELALQMSMMATAASAPAETPTAPTTTTAAPQPAQPQKAEFGDLLGDQAFLSDLLSSLPGVNPADARIQDMVASIRGNSEPKKEAGPEEKKEEEKAEEDAEKKK
jgi:26S proteasome regulatory subunit N10